MRHAPRRRCRSDAIRLRGMPRRRDVLAGEIVQRQAVAGPPRRQ